jgi:signal transduction histidine kinase
MAAAAKIDTLRRRSKRLRWAVRGGIGAVILAFWAVAALSSVSMRHAALRNAISNANNLAASFQDELTHTLGTISLTIATIAERVRAQGRDFDLYQWSRESPLLKDGKILVGIVSPDGMLISTTRSSHAKPLYLGDREHIRVQLDGTAKGLVIGKPLVARSIGKIEIPISARVDAKNGQMLGVISVIVPPEVLTPLHNSVDIGAHGTIGLVGLDHIVRARFSHADPTGLEGVGESVAGGPEPSAFPVNAAGYFIRTSVVDHVPRLFSYRRVGTYPLLVVVGLDLHDVYADASEHGRIIYSLATAMTLLLGGLAIYLTREIRARTEREIDLRTEREKLESTNRQLRISNEHAEAASHAKSMFLANMSHELRTPLNAIIGFSQVIKDQIKGPLGTPAYAEYASHIYTAGEHLHELIGDILDIAKIEAGAVELNEELIDPAMVVCDALATLEGQAKRKGISVQTNLPADLKNLRIRGDELRLRQVVINLLSNAVKFTPERGQVSITLDYTPGVGFLFAVADTGIGMTAKEIELALQTFGQVENTLARRNDGAGLGLPLARRLVELHAGRLEIESIKGKGTTVRAIIPEARIVPAAGIDHIAAA